MIIDMDKLEGYVLMNEGYRRKPYKDTEGIWTVGIGFNLEEGFSEEECRLILAHRLNKLIPQLTDLFPFFVRLCTVRKIVLLDMAYNLGIGGLMRFKRMLAALERGEYQLAADEMLDSRYAKQVKARSLRNARMMETGEWYEESS